MKKYGVNELRKMFLDFMESKGHLVMKSFSLNVTDMGNYFTQIFLNFFLPRFRTIPSPAKASFSTVW